MISRWW